MTHPTRHELRAEDLVLGYDGRTVLDGLELSVVAGQVTVIIGPNACGKSTLLRGLGRLLKPSGGRVVLDGEDIRTRSTREVATVLGLLPQQPVAPDGMTVAELVERGRHPHQHWFRARSAEDDAIVERALRDTDTLELAGRPVDALSGGQRQRVWIAMALAQQTDILLLDEPTTFLDLAHQLDVLDLLAEQNRERGTTVAMVLHDLNLAARYAHRLVLMRAGAVIAQGAPAEVLTTTTLRTTFGLDCDVVPDPVCGAPMVVPHSRTHRPGTTSLIKE